MKPLFEHGQEVVCLNSEWEWVLTGRTVKGKTPKKNEIYIVADPCYKTRGDQVFILLEDFPSIYSFEQQNFAPVMDTRTLKKELLEIFQPITII